MTVFVDVLSQAAKCLDVTLPQHQCALMFGHFGQLLAANQTFNLTRITDPAEAAARLYGDSLAPIAWARAAGIAVTSVLDVGTGAGFPALPLAIARDDWRITAVDSVGKKTRFVADCVSHLDLRNVRVIQSRAGTDRGLGRHDLVTFKAVTNPRRCLQTARDLVAPHGHVIIFHTHSPNAGQRTDEHNPDPSSGFYRQADFEYRIDTSDTPWHMRLLVFRRIN